MDSGSLNQELTDNFKAVFTETTRSKLLVNNNLILFSDLHKDKTLPDKQFLTIHLLNLRPTCSHKLNHLGT